MRAEEERDGRKRDKEGEGGGREMRRGEEERWITTGYKTSTQTFPKKLTLVQQIKKNVFKNSTIPWSLLVTTRSLLVTNRSLLVTTKTAKHKRKKECTRSIDIDFLKSE